MLGEAVGLSIAVAVLRGGKFSNIKDGVLEKGYLFILSFFIEFFTVYMAAKGVEFFRSNILLMHFLSYSLLFICIYFNRKSTAFKIIFVGVLLNFIVIMLNNGQMPVSVEALAKAGLDNNIILIQEGKTITHSLLTENTVFSFLSDIFYVAKPYPTPKAFSIGDVFMALGVFLYFQQIMIKTSFKVKNKQYTG